MPFFYGGGVMRGSECVLPQNILKLQSPKMRFLAFWGLKLRTEECVFIQENVASDIYQSHNQFVQAANK